MRKVHTGQTVSEFFGPEMPPVAAKTYFEVPVVDFPLYLFLVSAQLQCLRNIDLLAIQQFYYFGDQIQQANGVMSSRCKFSAMAKSSASASLIGQILARMFSHPASRAARKRLSPHMSE